MDFKLVVRSQDNKKTYNLDLYGDVDINVIFNINDIRNPESIKSNYTKQFTIPATHNNNKFFESLLYNGNYPTSFNPNFKASAQLYGDSSIIIDGYLQVTEIIKNDDNNVDAYNVVIYGEISSLFNDLSGLKVTDLDFSEYNHTWNYLNVKNSWNTSIRYNNIDAPFVLGRGYVYPFEWRGQTTNEMGVEDFYPAIYVKTIWDKVFKKAGKTYTSKFLNSKEFKSLVIPFSKQHIYLTEEQKKAAEFLVSQSIDKTLVNAAGNAVVMYPTIATTSGNINVTYNTETSDPSNLLVSGVFTASKKQFTNLGANVKVKIGYKANVGSGGTWKVIGNPMTCNVWLYNITTSQIVGSEIISIPNPSGSLLGPGPFYSSGECFVDYTGIIQSGHKFRVILNFTVPVGTTASKFSNLSGQAIGGTITPYLVGGTDFYSSIQENWLFEGDNIEMNQIVPDEITITDLLTSINKMFNLYWLPDGDKNFIIEPRDVLYANPDTQILDWTKKTNRNTDITITPLAELNNNKYIFTYSEGDDYYNSTYDIEYNEVYGTKIVEVLNDFVSDTKEIKPKFEASVMVRMNSSQRIAPAYVIQQEGFFEATEPKLRILYYGGLVTTNDFFLFKSKQYASGLMQYKYPYAGHFNNPDNPTYDINFGQCKQYYYNGVTKTTGNLFNNYWANSINDMIASDSHIWAGELHLTPFDIITMNLFDTIQMDQVFYKINKIEYNPLTELAKVELVKTTSFLTKPNATTVKPEVIGGSPNPWNPNPWSPNPWNPKPWVVDKTYETWYSPIQNPQWFWKQETSYASFRDNYVADRGVINSNTSLIETNNKNFTTTKYESSIHRNNFEAVNFIDIKGTDNYVAPAAYAVRVTGNNNRVMAAKNISVVGNNNTVERGLTNVSIVGDDIVARESNVSYVNGAIIRKGGIIEEFSLINGSVNEIQNAFTSSVNPNLIRNGQNKVQQIGGQTKINYLNGGVNTTLSPRELYSRY